MLRSYYLFVQSHIIVRNLREVVSGEEESIWIREYEF